MYAISYINTHKKSNARGHGKAVTFCAKTRIKAANFTTPLSKALAVKNLLDFYA
jgi:hypothetical protein